MGKWFKNVWDNLVTNIIFIGIMFLSINFLPHLDYIGDEWYWTLLIMLVVAIIFENKGFIDLVKWVKLNRAKKEIDNGEY